MNKVISNKKIFLYIIISTFIIINVFPTTAYETLEKDSILNNNGNILYVGGSGQGNYSNIQDAIDNASDGDTVFIFDESSPYYEKIIINKKINLIGENKNTTVIDANYTGSPITITSNNCIVKDLTIQNCNPTGSTSWENACIKIFKSRDVTIKNNIITLGVPPVRSWMRIASIELYRSSYNTIENNYIFEINHSQKWYSCGIRIHKGSTSNLIINNEITEYATGISTNLCIKNKIFKNYIHHNQYGIMSVRDFFYKISNNTILYNYYYGLEFTDCCFNTISNNNISYNSNNDDFYGGIILDYHYFGSNFNNVSENIISKNKPAGILVFCSYHNIITKNNFIDNYGEEGYPQRWWGNAFFIYNTRPISYLHGNTWKKNYWENSYSILKNKIKGIIDILEFPLLWAQFDWHPAKVPYEI